MTSNQVPTYSIRHLPEEERPRERLLRLGPEALTVVELLAILLSSGTKEKPVMQLSQQLIAHFGSLEKLSTATVQELCQIKGIGKAKAIKLRAAFSINQRFAKTSSTSKLKVENPLNAYNLVKDELSSETREVFILIFLDVKGCYIGHETAAIGTLTQALVHPREVFYPAIRNKAVSLVIVHNHPSGDLTPSKEDLELTKKLIEVGRMVGIPVNDHLIVSSKGYISLRQKSDLF